MSQGADQIRLAIGVFDTLFSLWRTVEGLIDDGLLLEQFCLVATAATAAEISRPADPGDPISDDVRQRVSNLCSQVETWPGTDDGHRVVATSGPLLDSLLRAQVTGLASTFPVGISAEHTTEMLKQVQNGALALIIRSLTPAQQRISTCALLDQSPHSVKTYDFAVPADQARQRQG